MKTIKVSEAIGPALDWLVAKCEGMNYRIKEKDDLTKHVVMMTLIPCPDNKPGCVVTHFKTTYFSPSTDWSQGGPIIEKKKMEIRNGKSEGWAARIYNTPGHCIGPTSLIAAMRCYVASKLGDEVEVPEELA